MMRFDLRDQLVPDGATGETEHRNGFPSAGVDLVSSHLCERCGDGVRMYRSGSPGVWTLVSGRPCCKTCSTWRYFGYRRAGCPSFTSRRSFRYFFNFGSKILITRVLHTLYMNGSYLLVGKFYSPGLDGIIRQTGGPV